MYDSQTHNQTEAQGTDQTAVNNPKPSNIDNLLLLDRIEPYSAPIALARKKLGVGECAKTIDS